MTAAHEAFAAAACGVVLVVEGCFVMVVETLLLLPLLGRLVCHRLHQSVPPLTTQSHQVLAKFVALISLVDSFLDEAAVDAA